MLKEAQFKKTPLAQLADRVSAYFIPFIISVSIFTGMCWLVAGQSISYALLRVVAVLVIACPCALGLATPLAFVTAAGRALDFGVLFKSGFSFQKASEINTIVFDKTGTLTKGKPKPVYIKAFGPFTEETILKFSGSVEKKI